jgi:hypothetical protein
MNTSQSSERESVANTQLEALVDEHAVAKFYGVSVATVRRWRWLRTGPKFHKIGALCRYRMADLEEFLRHTPTGGEQHLQPAMANVGHRSKPEAR